MIRRFTSLPLAGGRRWFAATAAATPSKFAPGDSVFWIDTKVVQHKRVPFARETSEHNMEEHVRSEFNRQFGTVVSVDEETKLVKVNFDQNGQGAFATGTWDCEEKMLSKIESDTIYDIKMFTHDDKPFDTSVLKGKVVMMLDMEDRQMASPASWKKLRQMYLKFKERGPNDQIAIMFFPHWNNSQPAEWFAKQLGLELEKESIFVMKKLPCNGPDTQPAYQWLKTYYPGRVDWRYSQANASTVGWNAPRWILNREGKVVEKLLGGNWTKCFYLIDDILKR